MNSITKEDFQGIFKDFPGTESYGFMPIKDTTGIIYQLKRSSIGKESGFWEKIELLDINRDETLWNFIEQIETTGNRKNIFNIIQQALVNWASELGYSCTTVEFDLSIAIAPNIPDKIIAFREFR